MMVLRNIGAVPGLYWKLCKYAKEVDTYPHPESYAHIHGIMQRAVNKGNVDLQVFGRENIPAEDGFMLFGNHQGLFDVVALVSDYDRPLAAVFKQELKDVPFLREIVKCTGSFAMDRDDVRQSLTVIRNVTEEVKKGRTFLIFPEGTRSKNGNVMGEFHGGSFKAATRAKCTIVPLAFIDSFKVLDQKGSKPLTVQMHYLEPIPYEEYKDMNTTEIAAMVKERIQKVIDENT